MNYPKEDHKDRLQFRLSSYPHCVVSTSKYELTKVFLLISIVIVEIR